MITAFIAKKKMKEGFEAMSQHDLPKVMSAWQDDGTLIYPGEVPGSGTFKGKAAIEGWFRKWFDQFPSAHFDIQNVFVRNTFGLRNNVIVVQWDIHVTNRDGRAGKDSGISLFEIKGGKLFWAKDFIFDQGENFKRLWGAV